MTASGAGRGKRLNLGQAHRFVGTQRFEAGIFTFPVGEQAAGGPAIIRLHRLPHPVGWVNALRLVAKVRLVIVRHRRVQGAVEGDPGDMVRQEIPFDLQPAGNPRPDRFYRPAPADGVYQRWGIRGGWVGITGL